MERIRAELTPISPEQVVERRKKLLTPKRILVALAIAGPVLAGIILSGCSSGESSPGKVITPTPIATAPFPDLGENNVPFVSIVDEDTNGDGEIDVNDARRQKGTDWLPGLNFNSDFVIDKKDADLLKNNIRKLPVGPFDVNGDGHVTNEDLAIVEAHLGETVQNDPDPKIRQDKLMGSVWPLDEMIVEFQPDTPQKTIDDFVNSRGYINEQQFGTSLIADQVRIPAQQLKGTNLGNIMKDTSKVNSVVRVERFLASRLLDSPTRRDPVCEKTATPPSSKNSDP